MKPATRRQFLGLAAVGLEYMTKGCAPFYQMPVIPELKVTNKLFEHPITYATRKVKKS